MTDPAPPPIRRRQLALRLVQLRKAAGLTQDEAVERSGLSRSTISKLENAEQAIREKNVRLLAHAYAVGAPELDMLLRMAGEAKQRGVYLAHAEVAPDFARDYFELEAVASELWSFEVGFVPGVFQTEEYIRAVRLAFDPDATEEELLHSVALRTSRQSRFTGDRPPLLRVIVDQAVLLRPVGGAAVMVGQIDRLIDVSQLLNVRLQILPLSVGAHPAVGHAFVVLRFDDTPGMDVVYLESMRSATYHEKPDDIAHHVEMFERLSALALAPEKTRDLLVTLRDGYGSDRSGNEV